MIQSTKIFLLFCTCLWQAKKAAEDVCNSLPGRDCIAEASTDFPTLHSTVQADIESTQDAAEVQVQLLQSATALTRVERKHATSAQRSSPQKDKRALHLQRAGLTGPLLLCFATHHKTGTVLARQLSEIMMEVVANVSWGPYFARGVDWNLTGTPGDLLYECDDEPECHDYAQDPCPNLVNASGPTLGVYQNLDEATLKKVNAGCGNYRMVHIVRDPVALTVSGYEYHSRVDNDTAEPGRLNSEPPHEPVLPRMGPEVYGNLSLQDGLKLEAVMEINTTLRMMLEVTKATYFRPNVLTVPLESFSEDFDGTARRIFSFLLSDDVTVDNFHLLMKGAHDVGAAESLTWLGHEHISNAEESAYAREQWEANPNPIFARVEAVREPIGYNQEGEFVGLGSDDDDILFQKDIDGDMTAQQLSSVSLPDTPKHICFVHVGKSGGNSLVDQLDTLTERDWIGNFVQVHSHDHGLLYRIQNNFLKVPAPLSRHSLSLALCAATGNTLLWVRDPVSRFVSVWNFFAQDSVYAIDQEDKYAEGAELRSFIIGHSLNSSHMASDPSCFAKLDLDQLLVKLFTNHNATVHQQFFELIPHGSESISWYLDADNCRALDVLPTTFVGRQESMDEDWDVFVRDILGAPPSPLPHIHETSPLNGTLSSFVVTSLRKFYAEDYTCFARLADAKFIPPAYLDNVTSDTKSYSY